MKRNELLELCQKKNYSDYFSRDLIGMYPYMIKRYDEDTIDKFLFEWKYVLVNNPGASGAIYRDKKEITVNEYNHYLWAYRIITATIHEVGHALGTLKIDTNTFLSDGVDNNDFFSKMDEAIVSDYQDDLFTGELQYDYTDSYNFKCRGDILHIENYAVQKLYYNIFKIILGDKSNLITQMMYEKNPDKKKELFNEIVTTLSSILNQEQFKCLMNSSAILIYNHGYSMIDSGKRYSERRKNRRDQLYNMNYQMVTSGEIKLEEYNIQFETWFQTIYDDKYKRVINYVESNGISNIEINEQCDNLCEMILDYLIDQLEKMTTFNFGLIKSACIYFSKINNKSKALDLKTQKLRKLLYQHLSTIEFKFCKEITDKFNNEEIINIIIKLLSLNNITLDTLREVKMMKNNNDKQDFIYAIFGDAFIKIGRYINLPKDDMKKYHDLSMGDIYVDTVIPQINLSYNKSIGDPNINEDLKYTDISLCEVTLKQKSFQK